MTDDATAQAGAEEEVTSVETEVPESDAETEAQPGEAQDAEPSESSTEKETDAKESDKYQDRINELTRLRRDAERDRDYWRQQAETKSEPEPEPDLGEIKTLEDFEYDERAYQKYLFGEARKFAVESAKRVLAEEQERAGADKRLATHKEREAAYAKDHSDYFTKTRSDAFACSQAMFEVASEMEDGPAVLHHLARNPQSAERIARLSPHAAALELGRIAERLSKPKGPSVSKAPEPAPKIAAKSPATTISPGTPESDKLSTDEWLKRRSKQLGKR